MASATKENCPPLEKKRNLSRLPVSTKQKSTKSKPAPDFSKLHRNWNRKFEMGKACQKKGTTQVQEFDLTQPGTKFNEAEVRECDENAICFTPDMKSLHSILSDTGITSSMATERTTIATSRVHSQTKNQRVFSELPCWDSQSKRRKTGSRFAKEQHEHADEEGIKTPKPAVRQTVAPASYTPIQQVPRNSIYCQEPSRMSLYESLTQYRTFAKSRLDSQLHVSNIKQEDDATSKQAPQQASMLGVADKLSSEPQSSSQLPNEQGCSTPKSTHSVAFQESPFVKGPNLELIRNSVYVNVIHKPILTPTSTTPCRSLSCKTSSTKARRVLNPNFKHTTSNSTYTREESSSVKKIRKILRWADILESPSTFPKPKEELVEHVVQGCREASASEGNGQSCSEIRLLDESSSPVSHPTTSSALQRHASIEHHNTPEERTTQSGHAVSALHRTHTAAAGDSRNVSHLLIAAGETRCHSDDICRTQIQVLDEQKRKIQREMLQLKVAMEEESRGQVDNHQSAHQSISHTHHLPHHPIVPISLPPHPTTISPSEPHLAVDNHPSLISSHHAMQTLHSFATSAIPQPNFDLPPGINLSSRVNIEQPSDASNINLAIMQQLEAAKQKQEELRKLQLHLEQQLHQCAIQEQTVPLTSQSGLSAGQPTHSSLLSATAECNNNDLKDSMPCIPIVCPPCRQEHSSVDSSDVNDNYCSEPAVVRNKLDNPMDVDHAGHDPKTEHLFMDTENSKVSETVPTSTDPESFCTSWLKPRQKLNSVHDEDSVFKSTVSEQSKCDTVQSCVNLECVVDCGDDVQPSEMQDKHDSLTTKPSSKSFITTGSAGVSTQDICSSKQLNNKSQLSNMSSFISGSSLKQSASIILPTAEHPEKLLSRDTSACEIEKIVPPIWTPLALKVAASLTSSQVTSDNSVDVTRNQSTLCEVSTVNNSSVSVDVVPVQIQNEPCKLGSLSLRANLKTSISPVREKQTIFDCSLYMDALLDDEVAFFSCRLKTYFCDLERERHCPDPVAMTLSGGDDMHFVPIAEDSSLNGPMIGSAFSLYYNIQDRT